MAREAAAREARIARLRRWSSRHRGDLRASAASLGLVALLLVPAWSHVLPNAEDYYRTVPRAPGIYLSLLLLMVLLGALAVGLALWVRRQNGSRLVRSCAGALFLLTAFVALHGILVEALALIGWPPVRPWVVFVPFLALVITLVVPGSRWMMIQRRLVAVTLAALLLFAPLPALYAGAATFHAVGAVGDVRVEAASLSGPPPEDAGGARVVWVVFDEFDKALVERAAAEGLHLPELERLASEGVSFEHARAADSDTIRSVPSMTIGARVASAEPEGTDDLRVELGDGSTRLWGASGNVFRTAHQDGHDVAIAGVLHPYCRIFEDVVAACTMEDFRPPDPTTLTDHWSAHIRALVPSLPGEPLQDLARRVLGDRPDERQQEIQAGMHQRLMASASDLVARPELDLVYLHFNVPHPTGRDSRGFYDVERGTFATGHDADYWDNLVLADQTIGTLRSVMEEAGTWKGTTFIVTSDHGYRSSLWGAPIIDGSRIDGYRTSHWVPFVVHPAADWEGGRGHVVHDEVHLSRLGPLVTALTREEVHDLQGLHRVLQGPDMADG